MLLKDNNLYEWQVLRCMPHWFVIVVTVILNSVRWGSSKKVTIFVISERKHWIKIKQKDEKLIQVLQQLRNLYAFKVIYWEYEPERDAWCFGFVYLSVNSGRFYFYSFEPFFSVFFNSNPFGLYRVFF